MMAAQPDRENHPLASDDALITIAEASTILRVSVPTIKRWLKERRLHAFRLGPRQIRIRRSDLDQILTPLDPAPNQQTHPVYKSLEEIPLMTGERLKQALEALEAARELTEQQRARRGGRSLGSSTEFIREAREERPSFP